MHAKLASVLACLALLCPRHLLSQEREWEPAPGLHGACAWLANPAVLAAGSEHVWELQLLAISGTVANDAVNLSLYREYNGEFLTAEDKGDILDAVPGSTVEGTASGWLDILGARLGRYALTTRTYAGAALELDRDFLDLLFFGNELNRRYQLINAGSSLAYSSFGISYARPAGEVTGWYVSAGAAIRYVVGWEAAEVVESRGQVVTEPSGVSGWGESRVRSSEGRGRGVAFDMGGWAAKRNWEVAASLRELGPAIRWQSGREETYSFEIDGWTFEQGDTLYNEEKHTRDIGQWFSPLPTCLEIMVAHHRDWGSVSLRWNQGLREIAGMTTTPRVVVVGSWISTPWIRPWLGLELGSPEGFSLPFGLALQLGPVGLNAALTGCRLPPMSSKALGLALSISAGSG